VNSEALHYLQDLKTSVELGRGVVDDVEAAAVVFVDSCPFAIRRRLDSMVRLFSPITTPSVRELQEFF
jgi:hypothetical protein